MQDKKDKNGKKELNPEEIDQVSGGAINERTEKYGFLNLKNRRMYDVTRDDTGEVIKSYDNLNQAYDLDRYMNPDKKRH